MLVRVDDETKERFERVAKRNGFSVSEVIRDLMKDYIKERDKTAQIGDLWNRMSVQARVSGLTVKDIPRIIKEVRDEKRKQKLKNESCD